MARETREETNPDPGFEPSYSFRPATPDDDTPENGKPGKSGTHKLGDRTFRQGTAGLMAGTKDGGEYILIPGQITVSRVMELKDLDSERRPQGILDDTLFDVTYQPDSSHEYQGDVSVKDVGQREPAFLDELGISARTAISMSSRATLGNALKAVANTAIRQNRISDAYSCAGPLWLPNGEYVFLRPGKPAITAAGFDDSLTCRFPNGIGSLPEARVFDFDDPSNEDQAPGDFAALMNFLDLFPDQPEIGLTILGTLAWGPYSSIRSLGNLVTLLSGETGSRKTAVAGLLLAAQSSQYTGGPGIDPPVTVNMRHNQSTAFGTDLKLHAMSGITAIADDLFAGKMADSEIRATWKRLSGIANNTVTQTGGTRGGGGGRQRWSDLSREIYPRSTLLMTAERLPRESEESSATARLVILKLDSPVNLAVLTQMQGESREMSRAHSGLIRASLPELQRVRAGLAWGQETVREWGLTGHARIVYGYARALAGLYTVAERMRDVWEIDPVPALNDWAKTVRKAAEDQSRRGGMRAGKDTARDPVQNFCRYFRQVIAGNPLWLASPEMGHGDIPMAPAAFAYDVGWHMSPGLQGQLTAPMGRGAPIGAVVIQSETGRVPWRPVRAVIRANEWERLYDAVNRAILADAGYELPSRDETRELLANAGILRSAQSQNERLWGGKPRCYVFDLSRLLGKNDGPDGPEDGPLSEPESHPPGSGEPAPGQDDPGLFPARTGPDSDGPNGATDPSPQETKTRPGPCRGCGRIHANGRAGYLCDECQARTESGEAIPFAILGTDGLYFPGGSGPASYPLPDSLAGCYRLAELRNIRRIWVHPEAARAMKLPALDKLPSQPIGSGYPHKWAELPAGMKSDPEGMAVWVTVWPEGKPRKDAGRVIVLPHLDDRIIWREAESPQILADALAVFHEAMPAWADYWHSPNVTMGQVAKRACRSLKSCGAIIRQEIPPAVSRRPMLGCDWKRKPAGPERSAGYVVTLDRNKAELSAMSTPVGVGEPEHVTGPVEFNPKLAGYYRLASQPENYALDMPTLQIAPGNNGAIWAARPEVELLNDLGLLPGIVEAYVWPNSKRVLDPLYRIIRQATEYLNDRRDSPAGAIAYAALKDCWHPFIGNLAKTRGPAGPDDRLYRPDIRDHLKAEQRARMFRNLIDARNACGRAPLAMHADAVDYAANGPDDLPEGLKYDPVRGGAWKIEKTRKIGK